MVDSQNVCYSVKYFAVVIVYREMILDTIIVTENANMHFANPLWVLNS